MHDHELCKDYLKQISDYIDGDLSSEVCATLEAHIQECVNCRIVVNTLRRTIDLYHVTSEDDILPDEVRERLFARLKLDDPNHV